MNPIKELRSIANALDKKADELEIKHVDIGWMDQMRDSFEEWAENYEQDTTARGMGIWLTNDPTGQKYLQKLYQNRQSLN